MTKPDILELGDGTRIPILYEDRAVLAVDKPAGWLLVPVHWRETRRNLQAALESAIAAGAFWARSRNLRYLRFAHRLDAETSGVLLLARSAGVLGPLSALFERRQVQKGYLAVVRGEPRSGRWTCRWPLAEDPRAPGRMRVDRRAGRPAETEFEWLTSREDARQGKISLIEARPHTGRTHQIRVHLEADGHPVVGDPLYGEPGPSAPALGLRAVSLAYHDPFTRRPVRIEAPCAAFLATFGFRPRAGQGPG